MNNQVFSSLGIKIIGILMVVLLAGLGWIVKMNFAGDAEAKKQIERKEDKTDHDKDIARIEKGIERIEDKQEEGFRETRENMSKMQEAIIEVIKAK